MKAAIIATGSELITGLVKDSNSSFLARNLNNIGFEIENIFICGDEKKDIKKIISYAADNSDLIFITGGLGPTEDDKTKEAFAEALNLKLKYSKTIEKKLQSYFSNHNSNLTDNNLSQAYYPEGAEIIENNKGTAPVIKYSRQNKLFYLLPGVPAELKYLFKNKILANLKKISNEQILIKEFNFIGIGESTLASQVDKLNLNSVLDISYQAGRAEVKLRIKINNGSSLTEKEKRKEILEAADTIKKEFKEYIYGEDQKDIVDKIHKLLTKRKLTISTAESFTGGLIAERLSQKPGSSNYFLGSIVAYNEKIKKNLLKVDAKLLKKYGVVSRECAAVMAENAAEIFNSDLAIGSTGAAGPASHNGEAAGTMFISIYYQGKTKTFKITKNYGREMNCYYSSQTALFESYKLIKESEVK